VQLYRKSSQQRSTCLQRFCSPYRPKIVIVLLPYYWDRARQNKPTDDPDMHGLLSSPSTGTAAPVWQMLPEHVRLRVTVEDLLHQANLVK
jgi:hypothetical protein